MSARRGWVAGTAALAGPIVLAPLFLRPALALAMGVAGLIALVAVRSVAYPVALAGVPPVIFGIFSGNPLPEGAASVVLASAAVLAIVATVQREDDVPPPAVIAGAPLVLTVLLLCLLILREPPAPETDYGELKTAFFVVNNVVFLLAGIFVGWSAERLRTLLLATLAVSAAGAVVLVLYVAGGGHNPILPVALTFSDGDHSISMGRQMAAGLLVALAIVLGGGDRSARLVAAGSMPLLVTALIASGARGPVVALLAGAAALMFLGIQERAARRRLVVIALAVATAGAMVQVVVPQTSVVRSFSFASTDVEGTSSGRTEMWAQALRAFREHPELGIGTGGFAEVNPPMIYPHNLLLEVGAELGIAGVLLVLGLLGHAVVRLGRAHLRAGPEDRLAVATVAALLAAALANAMFSYALHANWEVWLWVGVGTALAARVLRAR